METTMQRPSPAEIDHALLTLEGQKAGLDRVRELLSAVGDMPADFVCREIDSWVQGNEIGIARLKAMRRMVA